MENKLSDYPRLLVSYMAQAFSTGMCAKAKRRKTGAIVLQNLGGSYFQPISGGYNGTRSGLNNRCEDVTGKTIPGVLHAERNCLTKMQQEGIRSGGSIVVVTFIPCADCVERMIDAKVSEVYYCEGRTDPDSTRKSLARMREHGLFVQQVPKKDVVEHFQAALAGLELDKFCGEDTEQPWREFFSTIQHMERIDKLGVLGQMEAIASELVLFSNGTCPTRTLRPQIVEPQEHLYDERLIKAMNTIWDSEYKIYKSFETRGGRMAASLSTMIETGPDAFYDLYGFSLDRDGVSQDCQQLWDRYSKVNLDGNESQ